jgi:hypothetical protein
MFLYVEECFVLEVFGANSVGRIQLWVICSSFCDIPFLVFKVDAIGGATDRENYLKVGVSAGHGRCASMPFLMSLSYIYIMPFSPSNA